MALAKSNVGKGMNISGGEESDIGGPIGGNSGFGLGTGNMGLEVVSSIGGSVTDTGGSAEQDEDLS